MAPPVGLEPTSGAYAMYARYFAKNSPPDCFLYAVTPAYLSDLGVR